MAAQITELNPLSPLSGSARGYSEAEASEDPNGVLLASSAAPRADVQEPQLHQH